MRDVQNVQVAPGDTIIREGKRYSVAEVAEVAASEKAHRPQTNRHFKAQCPQCLGHVNCTAPQWRRVKPICGTCGQFLHLFTPTGVLTSHE